MKKPDIVANVLAASLLIAIPLSQLPRQYNILSHSVPSYAYDNCTRGEIAYQTLFGMATYDFNPHSEELTVMKYFRPTVTYTYHRGKEDLEVIIEGEKYSEQPLETQKKLLTQGKKYFLQAQQEKKTFCEATRLDIDLHP